MRGESASVHVATARSSVTSCLPFCGSIVMRAVVRAGILLAVLFGCAVPAWADDGAPAPSAGGNAAAPSAGDHVAGAEGSKTPAPITHYTLSPDKLEKARHLGQLRLWGAIVGFVWTALTLWLLLRWRWAAKFRD